MTGIKHRHLNLSVEEHRVFVRDEDDILYELPVNIAQAALGAEVEVPTLDGDMKLKIPAGSQSGKIFRLKNRAYRIFAAGDRATSLSGCG